MPPRIGVYDSGAGGLTTLALLQAKLPECSWVYFADNARMPFGSKSGDEVAEAAEKAVRRLKREADIVVFGCNTASVTARPQGVFTLIPDLGHSLPSETLVLATPRTLAGLAAKEKGFMCASTAELAVLVEIQLSLRFKSRTRLDCSPLFGYLWERLAAFRGRAEKVLLGCSHYIYCAREIRALLGDADYSDGNAALTDAVRDAVRGGWQPRPSAPSEPRLLEDVRARTKFVFSGANERTKYLWILSKLHESYVPHFFNTTV